MTETIPFSSQELIDLGATAVIAIIAIYFLFQIARNKKENGKIMEILRVFEENHFSNIQSKLERMDEKLNKVDKIDEKLDKIITLLEIIKERFKNKR
jgi:hypothetical protein